MALTYVGESGQNQQGKNRSGSMATGAKAKGSNQGNKSNAEGNRSGKRAPHVIRQSSLLAPGAKRGATTKTNLTAEKTKGNMGNMGNMNNMGANMNANNKSNIAAHNTGSSSHDPRNFRRPDVRLNVSSKASVGNVSSSLLSSSLSPRAARVRRLKTCCRLTAEFLFTQVGVGALVIAYTLLGASMFQYVETQTQSPDQVLFLAEERRNATVQLLWSLTDRYNVLHREQWLTDMSQAVLRHQQFTVRLVQEEGYDQRTSAERWSFPTALMFALSTISMIGYGSVVPRSDEGKILTMVYAGVGIPLYILYFMNMGKVFAAILKFLYRKIYRWGVRRRWRRQTKAVLANQREGEEELPVVAPLVEAHYLDALERGVIVPSTTCLWVMSLYLLVGTVMFAEWEDWNYLDSIYFCVTSLAKIGFGDFVPGASLAMDNGANQVKLVINFVYILVGMAIVAMCYYLLKEEVGAKIEKARNAIEERCRPCTTKIKQWTK